MWRIDGSMKKVCKGRETLLYLWDQLAVIENTLPSWLGPFCSHGIILNPPCEWPLIGNPIAWTVLLPRPWTPLTAQSHQGQSHSSLRSLRASGCTWFPICDDFLIRSSLSPHSHLKPKSVPLPKAYPTHSLSQPFLCFLCSWPSFPPNVMNKTPEGFWTVSFKKHAQVLNSGFGNETLFRSRVFSDAIKLRILGCNCSGLRAGAQSNDRCLSKKRRWPPWWSSD